MPFFAVLILFAYNTKPYAMRNMEYVGGPLGLRAIFQALNMMDILSAFVRGPMRLLRGQEENIGAQDRDYKLIVHPSDGKAVVQV